MFSNVRKKLEEARLGLYIMKKIQTFSEQIIYNLSLKKAQKASKARKKESLKKESLKKEKRA